MTVFRLFNKVLQAFLYPIKHNGLFIIMLTILFVLPDAFYYIHTYQSYSYTIYLIAQGFVISYILALVCSLTRHWKKVYSIINSIVLIFAFIVFYIDATCVFQHQARFNADFAAIVLGTNYSEAKEFISTFASPISIFLSVISLCLFVFALRTVLSDKKRPLSKVILAIYTLFILTCFFLVYRNPSVWKDGPIGKIRSLIQYNVPHLKDYYTHPHISINNGQQPQNVVLIIGESLTKHHSSLYGYEKRTNPLLESLRDTSSLVVFSNVTSAATATINSFKYMMSTYTKDVKGQPDWYKCTSLPEILSQCHYSSYWISNQAQGGNSIINAYMELFSDNKYAGDNFSGDERNSYDGELIGLSKPFVRKKEAKKFFLYHLMGSHFKFNLRYPEQFNRFHENNYLDKIEDQREILAAYDNSVLYNDYVVYSIIKEFEKEEAIIIYLSDHGLDVFYTADDYAAHAKVNDPVSMKYGTEIPFLIYTTKKFNAKYPELAKNIQLSKNNDFRTDNLIYVIMDIIGVTKFNDMKIKEFSIFRHSQ